jgi:hypothetical protein
MDQLIERVVREYLLEEKKFPKQKGLQLYDNMLYKIISTYHQWFDRHGDNTYDTNVDLFYEKNNADNDYRIGVSDRILVHIIQEKIDKIIQSFKIHNPCNKRIIFTKKRDNNEDEEFFDFVEFVIQKDGNELKIVSSAFSEDGNFLYFGVRPRSKKENLKENLCKSGNIVVEL